MQEDIIKIDDFSQWEYEWLNQEEELSKILKDKKQLTHSEIKELTKIIINSLRWDREYFMAKRKQNFTEFIFSGYFARYRILNFGKKLADKYNIDFDDEEELLKKLSKLTGIKKKLKEVIYESIEDGLFFDEYIPMCNSGEYNIDGEKTKLKEKEILESWITEKNKKEKEIQKYIDNGDFVIKNKVQNILELKIKTKIITGESLYYSDSKLPFVQEYKKQADELVVYGILFNLLKIENIPKKYGHILAYREIILELSEIIGMRVSKNYEDYMNIIEDLSNHINRYLSSVDDQVSEYIFTDLKLDYEIKTFFENERINLKNVKPSRNTTLKLFTDEAERLLGSEWTRLD